MRSEFLSQDILKSQKSLQYQHFLRYQIGICFRWFEATTQKQPSQHPQIDVLEFCCNTVFLVFFLNHKGFFVFLSFPSPLKIHRLPGGEGDDGAWSGWQLMQRSRAVSCKSWWIANIILPKWQFFFQLLYQVYIALGIKNPYNLWTELE